MLESREKLENSFARRRHQVSLGDDTVCWRDIFDLRNSCPPLQVIAVLAQTQLQHWECCILTTERTSSITLTLSTYSLPVQLQIPAWLFLAPVCGASSKSLVPHRGWRTCLGGRTERSPLPRFREALSRVLLHFPGSLHHQLSFCRGRGATHHQPATSPGDRFHPALRCRNANAGTSELSTA